MDRIGKSNVVLPGTVPTHDIDQDFRPRHESDPLPPEGVAEDWVIFVFRKLADLTAEDDTATLSRLNDAAGHFDLIFITAVTYETFDDDAIENTFQMRIFEGDDARSITSNSLFIDGRNGTGNQPGRPYYLERPYRFPANSYITIELDEVEDVNVEIALHGRKIAVC